MRARLGMYFTSGSIGPIGHWLVTTITVINNIFKELLYKMVVTYVRFVRAVMLEFRIFHC